MAPRILIALLCAIVMSTTDMARALAADRLVVKKSPVKLIDTGLENMEPYPGPSQAAIWVDDHRLIAGVPLERSAYDPKHIGRTVIHDLRTGKTQELMRYAHPLCWDGRTGQAIIAAYPNPDDSRVWRTLAVAVDREARILGQREVAALSWDVMACMVKTATDDQSLRDRVIAWLRPGHGYIDLGRMGKSRPEVAVFHRPDGKKVEIAQRGWTIIGLRYLNFLDKYQLDSGTGCLVQGEKCPPDIHVLDPSGDVTTIALPAAIFKLMPNTSVEVVKDGYLFRSQSVEREEGYLLLRDGIVHHLWRPGSPGFLNPQRTETWGGETISPDGCKVAFARGARPSRVYVFDHCAIGR